MYEQRVMQGHLHHPSGDIAGIGILREIERPRRAGKNQVVLLARL